MWVVWEGWESPLRKSVGAPSAGNKHLCVLMMIMLMMYCHQDWYLRIHCPRYVLRLAHAYGNGSNFVFGCH